MVVGMIVLLFVAVGVVAYVRDRMRNARLRRQVEVLMHDPTASFRGMGGIEKSGPVTPNNVTAYEAMTVMPPVDRGGY